LEAPSGKPTTRIKDAIASLIADCSCTTRHTSVVGLFTAGNDWVLVEVDGCHRVYGGSAHWRQAAPALLAALS